ncbi:ANKRD17 [Symbiodinium natans]|uniref:ANKRD17 protein n=1 Tax=Symbiodinium natans TaxID=878477 RepID=A0A812SD23_9DINO|nr:ANKRD17 [Symbiodinium natans]
MQDYAESVSVILGQREELRALVVAGECFERQAQAGAGRWIGNSKHFLEEEKFRRRFVRQYPELRDKMIESIEAWETAEEKTFLHNGIALGARLREARDHGVALASAQGDLSIMSVLLHILAVTEENLPISPSAKSSKSPTPKSKGSKGGALQLPQSNSGTSLARASSESVIPRRSPSPQRRGIKRQQSAADLTVRLPPIGKV